MHGTSRSLIILFILLICYAFTLQGVEIKTTKPNIYEAGKSTTIQWDMIYSAKEKYKITELNMFKDGKPLLVGTDNGIDENFKALSKSEANIELGPLKIVVTINKLHYGDVYNFTCNAIGQTADFTRSVKIENIVINNVKGGVTSCGDDPAKPVYEVNEIAEKPKKKLYLSLCGVPSPSLTYSWAGQDNAIAYMSKSYQDPTRTHRYDLTFENANREHCGTSIDLRANGHNQWANKSKLMVRYKPSKIVNDFKVIKKRHFSGANCTIFNLPKPETPCKQSFKVFAYDGIKDEIEAKIHQGNELKVEDCEDQALFNGVKFARIQAVSWNKEDGEMSDYFEVEETIEKEIPSGESRNKTTLIVTVVCIVLVIFVVIAIFFICKKYNRCSSNFVPVFCFCCHDNNKTNENKKLNNDTENTYDLLRKPNNNDNSRQQPTDNEDNKHYVNISNENTPAHYEPGRPTNDNTYESYSAAKNAQKNPDRSVYSELGEGGRTGPRDAPIPQSNYAEARESDALRECLNSPPKDIFDSPNEQDNTYQSLGGNVQNSSYPEQKGSHLLPENYNINTGVPVYNDPKSSIRNNPPTWEKLQRPTAPGATPLQPVNVPKFNR